MVRKFYIGDLHLYHENALRFDARPFKNMDEMLHTIIRNWQQTVSVQDEVYILGDMFWKTEHAVEVCKQLPGKKYLILGNHDKLTDELRKQFVSVQDIMYIADNERKVFLCHYPVAHWKNADRGTIHLYAHIHESRDNRPFVQYVKLMQQRGLPYECYNTGCMLPYMQYTPRTLEEIICGGNAYYNSL